MPTSAPLAATSMNLSWEVGQHEKKTMGPLISGNKTSPAITCEFRGMNSESNMYVQRLLEKSHEATIMFQIVHVTLIQFSTQLAR